MAQESDRQLNRRNFLLSRVSAPGPEKTLRAAAEPTLAAGEAQAAKIPGAAAIVPPNKTYRSMEWEFHTPPEEGFNVNLKAAMVAARDSGAQALMLYSQDHWGYAFYTSDVGVRHPRLTNDFFGTEVRLAREQGMSAICYYSLQYNNQVVFNHPDWAWVDEQGVKQRRRERWFLPCLDSPYRQYVLGMMNELFSRYEVDELFLDTYGIQFHEWLGQGISPFCFCPHTVTAWDHDHPGDPYREGFKTTEGWYMRYEWHKQRTLIDMLDEIIAVARKHRPHVLISLNGGPEVLPNEVMQRVSFIYAEPITTTTGISIGSILMRGWGRPDYQAGVFSQQGYLDTYPGSIPRIQADALIVQNARTFIVGNAPIISDLDGQGFSKRWFAVAKETWADISRVDSLLAGVRPVLSTAMLYSDSTREALAGQKRPVDFRRSTVGALESLTYAGRPVESVAEHRLTPEELAKFEALVLPEVEVLSDAQTEAIRNWVKQGGTLLASYKCGLLDEKRHARSNFPLADVLGVDFESEERRYVRDETGERHAGDSTSTYLESSGHKLAAMLAVSTVGMPGAFLNVKRTTSEEVMRYRLPFMVEDVPHNHWFNWGAPPPGTETGGAAVAYNRFGKGQSLYFGVPIFWAMQGRPFWIKAWVPELMRQLVRYPIAELRPEPFTEYLHGSFFYNQAGDKVLVQVLNTVEAALDGEYRAVPRVSISVDSQRLKVTGARTVWPHEEDLEVHPRGGRTEVILQNPPRYTALYLKL